MLEKNRPILVTGAKGFVGKNLCLALRARGYETVLEYDMGKTEEDLKAYARDAQFVFHLAGVNRPKDPKEFYDGNSDLTTHLTELLLEAGNRAPILLTSSAQVGNGSDYGKSKALAEDTVFGYERHAHTKVYVYRMPGLFGKWCRPNYNSVVATFCHNIAHDLPIEVRDPGFELPLVYIDDVIDCFIAAMEGTPLTDPLQPAYCAIAPIYHTTLGELSEKIRGFHESRSTLAVPDLTAGGFEKKLYSTYLSYLEPKEGFRYPLVMHGDDRGSFTEFLRTPERGQVSVNISKPGITKGNHWHSTKNEKYLVVSGKANIRFRLPDSDVIYDYHVSGEKLEVVDIPVGYTHCITNEGDCDLVTVMWVNECFDAEHPDTFALPVEEK
ncbi:NAD-dependent epimerase/dehydratase family protein [Pygmaiobacter massiliensis]|uniref:polysaccharide biosynthesis C-terminal domain-containing protein n=1 Tax=Pygmaiobacter massiliensis TaxID=1917873 RepID=UPI000C7C6CC1|nr:NAD-dependent epimerase/dehydratase family protein [Pygmaiobacter massiliensis]